MPPNASQRKLLKRNSNLVVSVCKPWSTEEQYALLQRYLHTRHPGGGMTEMDELDYADMVEHSPVDSYVIEYREPTRDGSPGKLVGACLTDRQGDGLSMIYSFFEPRPDVRPSMGNFIIMDHIMRARKTGLAYVYLGYWVEGSRRMQYKVRYQPLEQLGPGGWVRFGAESAGAAAALPGGVVSEIRAGADRAPRAGRAVSQITLRFLGAGPMSHPKRPMTRANYPMK